jgi:hypothetical protein
MNDGSRSKRRKLSWLLLRCVSYFTARYPLQILFSVGRIICWDKKELEANQQLLVHINIKHIIRNIFPIITGTLVYIAINHYETHSCHNLLYFSFLITVFWDVTEYILEDPASPNLQSWKWGQHLPPNRWCLPTVVLPTFFPKGCRQKICLHNYIRTSGCQTFLGHLPYPIKSIPQNSGLHNPLRKIITIK